MKKIILHVGAHKTGTTTIQKTLAHYHANFKKQGYLYVPSHKKVGNLRLKQFLSTYDDSEKQNWIDFFNNITEKKVVISDEEYSLFNKQKLINIKSFFEELGYKISVHYFVREPFSWKQSDCKQIIRSGNACVEDFNVKTGFNLKRIYRKFRYKHHYSNHAIERYVNIPQKLDDIFSKENVFFHYFDDAITQGLMNYFMLQCLKLNSTCQDLNIQEVKSNESLSLLALKIASFRNKHLKGKKRSFILSNFINNLPGDKKTNFILLSHKEENAIKVGLKYITDRNGHSEIKIKKGNVDMIKKIDNHDIAGFIEHLNDFFLDLESDLNELKKISKKLESEQRYQMAYKLYYLESKLLPNSPETKNRLEKIRKIINK